MKKAERPVRAVGYVRVSTAQQADDGNSLEAQRAKLEAYAKVYDIELAAIEIDAGESASSLTRPGLQRALARLDAFEVNAILITKLDRLTRNIQDLCSLIDTYFKDGQNVLMSVAENINTTTASGRLVLNLLTVVSQWEREAAAERTAAVMQHLRATGKYMGGWPPYGYALDEDGHLIECPSEQAVISRARALRAGGHALRAIACALGNNPRTGKAFQTTQIVRML